MPSNDYSDVMERFGEIAALPADDPARTSLRDALVERCLPLADHVARRFEGRGEALEDLVQVARLGLVKAVNRFDPTRGADFLSYAIPTIMGEVRRHFRDTGWAVHVPRRMQELHLALGKAADHLSHSLRRAPTVHELANELGTTPAEVTEAIAAGSSYQTLSMEAATSSDGEGLPISETLGDVDEALDQVDDHEALRPLIAALPERERQILMLRFFGNMTQSEIGASLGISQMHVSRLLARTLAKLRQDLD
jgi:RNA polymerase sigma-B factor